jgi:ABC-type multidrug transport system ATPase subunit
MVPEGRGIFTRMTVLENLQMGAWLRRDSAAVRQEMDEIFANFPRLAERQHQLAGLLSGGEQQLLALNRALLSQPRLLILDEPSMGLAPLMVENVFRVIATLRQRGVALLLIEQNARLALEATDSAWVMDSGSIVERGASQALLADDRIAQIYLGEMPAHTNQHQGKTMKTVKISALSAAILLSGFASSAAWSAASETVIIGLAGPLTGPSARIGKDLENGAQLAIDDINKQHPTIGGKAVTFKLQSEDDQSDPRTAVAVAQRLVDSGVAGVVGHWNTGTSIPAARVYHDAGIAQVAPVATGHAYTRQGFDTSFRVMGHDDDGGQFAGQYAVQTLKAKRIAVIDDRTAFGQGLADEFIKSLEAQGVKIVDRQYVDDKTVDFSAVLTAIRSKNADLIFFGGVDSQAARWRGASNSWA